MNVTIVLAGNPNAGKTTLFNGLTGARQHVGNYPGVTVEKKIAEAEKSLDEREKSLKEAAEKAGKNAAQLEAEMVKLDEHARKLMAESQK